MTAACWEAKIRFENYLDHVRYKDWGFEVMAVDNRLFLRVKFVSEGDSWNGRQWFISQHSTKSEIIQTALKAVLTAEEHETREKFLYKGRAIFGPHIDVDTMHGFCEITDERA